MDRLHLMDLFRRDMTGIEPTTVMHDDNPHPSLESNPLVFKREDSALLFRVWMAGRNSAHPEPAGEAQILGFINPKCMPVQEGYACTLNPVQEGQYMRPVFDRTPAAETAIRLLHDQIAAIEACDIGPRDLPMPYISREQVLELIGEARATADDTPSEGWPSYHKRKMETMRDLMRGLRDRYKEKLEAQAALQPVAYCDAFTLDILTSGKAYSVGVQPASQRTEGNDIALCVMPVKPGTTANLESNHA